MLTSTQKENLQTWITALTSGKYQQGQRRLRPTNDTYCCLGVVCDLFNTSGANVIDPYSVMGPKLDWRELSFSDFDVWAYSTGSGLPPTVVRLWVGLPQPHMAYLTRLNDGGRTFADIAEFLTLWMEMDAQGTDAPIDPTANYPASVHAFEARMIAQGTPTPGFTDV
jgi:hypothetical protein